MATRSKSKRGLLCSPAALAALLIGCGSDPEATIDEGDAAGDSVVFVDSSGGGDGRVDETSNPDDGGEVGDSMTMMDVTPDTSPATASYVYVGCSSGQIQQFTFDVATGDLVNKAFFAGGNNPSFLASTGKLLFAVNEGSNEVQSFSITPSTGALLFLNKVGSAGAGPAFVSIDGSSKYIFVANYGGGTVSVFPIGLDGKLGMKTGGDSPGPKAHAILGDPSNKFVYAPVLGADAVFQYSFDATKGTIAPLTPPKVSAVANAGPRHIAMHPTGSFAFVVNELDDTVMSLKKEASGALTVQQTLSTLPSGFPGSMNSGADIHVHPNGKFVYTSNRGHDSIAMFSIDAAGKLTSIGHEPTGGKTPRNFHIDPTGQILLAANQSSSNVVTFRIGADGKLTKLKTVTTLGPPAYVGVVNVPL